jgi:hypothetical protein
MAVLLIGPWRVTAEADAFLDSLAQKNLEMVCLATAGLRRY